MANIDDKKIPKGGVETPIVGRLHDVSEDHVVTGANEVFDDAFGERQSKINDNLRHYTKMAHIRIDAEEITRDHEDTQLRNELNAKQLEIGAVQTDSEPIPESPNMLPSGAVAFNLGWYKGNDNPEWVYCITDGAMRLLAGIKFDGSVEWMVGVPIPVKNYVDTHIQELIERLEELEEHILEELEKKVDKEEGKSLINKDCADGVTYIESPEFVEVKLDQDNRILEAIMLDGTKLLPAGYEVGGNVVKTISNPEYLAAWLDSSDHILFALKADGDVIFGCGIPSQIKEHVSVFVEMFHYEDNPEFIEVTKDSEDKVLEGIQQNGTKVIGGDLNVGGSVNINGDIRGLGNVEISGVSHKVIENPEFIEAKTDSDGKILAGRTSDGAAFENVSFATPKVSITGHTIENIEDSEGRSEITTDSEGKIISYRDKDGVKHEDVGIETNRLSLTDEGMSEFQQALRDSGFQPGGTGDYTDKDSMYIPEPRLAHLNIITDFNLTALTKTSDVKCQVEFYDGVGNYFKKWIILNGQGRSSLSFLKKGLGADFFNEDPNSSDFDEDNTFSIKFGDWVPQDSFHIKSYYTDWPRCTSPVVYKLTDEVVRTRGVMNDRPYKKYYVGEYSDAANANTQSDLDKNMETGARCFPDGFPVIVYQNGEFWGVNAWQLKKHRDNYAQSKKKATHIHLDGDMGTSHWNEVTPPQPAPWVPFWLWNGTINWDVYCSGKAGIETRNPKNLYCVDGKKYDADTHDAEIIDTATAEAWIAAGQIIPTGKTIDDTLAGYLRTTGKVRKSIEDLTTYVPTIRQMATIETNNGDIMIGAFGGDYDVSKNFGKGVWVVSEGRNYMSIHSSNTGNPVTDTNNWVDITDALADVKETIEDIFDLDTFIDFIVIGNVCGNNDAWDNNGQIITWGKLDGSDRLNWSVNMYDCDITFGGQWDGRVASAANNARLGSTYPLYKIFWDYYFDELKARYHELRDKGIFDADHITQLFRSWMDRVGYDNYAKEYKKWNESPCFRDGSQTYVNYPTTGGFYGSIERIYLWIKKRIQYMDAADFFDYNNN